MSARISLALTLLVISALPAVTRAAVPDTVQIYGALSAAGGGPVADGVYPMTFALYESQAGGSPKWAEGPADVLVKGGRFASVLGKSKPLTPALIAGMKAAWLSMEPGANPPLPRVRLHSVAWALQAGSLDCSGCVKAGHLGAGSITADKVGFTWAGSATKGGPATSAKVAADVQCTGCVSVGEMKFDADVDLSGNGLKAKKVTAMEMAAGTVTANLFVGDGSKLTGLKLPVGACSGKGDVVKGINPDGTLQCVAAMGATGLPADGLDEISNGQLTTEFVHVYSNAKAAPIPDNNPIGISSQIAVPDVGLVKGLKISVKVTSSSLAQLEVMLYDPNNAKHVLFAKNGKGKLLQTSYPVPTKPLSGDLGAWIGKNPKGVWRLKAVDDAFLNNKSDGAIESWSIQIDTLSGSKVEAKGLLLTSGGLQLLSAVKAPVTCDPARFGYIYANPTNKTVYVCNGEEFYPISLVTVGTAKNPAQSCQDMHKRSPASPTGVYWIDPDGGGPTPAFRVYCDMDTDGGGWTLVWSNRRGGTKHETNMKWATAIGTLPLVKGTLGEDPEKFQVYTGLKHWNVIAKGKQLRYSWSPDFGKPIAQSYRCTFNLAPSGGYAISFSGCKQLVGSVVPGLVGYHGGRKFTTVDKDQDNSGGNCAQSYSGSPFWYGSCWDGSINGGGQNGNGHKNAAYWKSSSGAWGTPDGQGGGNGWIFVR